MIPYGISDFVELKNSPSNFYYIDKTSYIPKLETYGRFLFLIRPRRFGKSLFLNTLDAYYNVLYKDRFNDIFKNTWILDNPTPEAHQYHVLKFDFSAVSTSKDIDGNFSDYCNSRMGSFLRMNNLSFIIDETQPAHKTLELLFSYLRENSIKLYIILDEYDNFVNNLLMHNEAEYKKLVSSENEAIYKEFFKLLKVATGDNDSCLKRMFITGVSPLALFDVTSGSNIGKNITNELLFHDILGINKSEFQELASHYDLEKTEQLPIEELDNWYNHYRFNENSKETIYNTDMILYYVDSLLQNGEPPRNLVDINVRVDYSKLKYLVHTNNNKLNGNFDALRTLFGDGSLSLFQLKDNFSAFDLKQTDNFISLLYYLGLITISRVHQGKLELKIPNNTVRIIMAEYIKSALDENHIWDVPLNDFLEGVRGLAYFNSLELFPFLTEKIEENSKIRDYIDGENFFKGFILAYMTLNPYYAVLTEHERNKGFIDIYLSKAPNITDDIPNILIELKYIPRGKFTEELLQEKINDAEAQLTRYAPNEKEDAVIVVYHGWELAYCSYFNKKNINNA